MSANILLVGEAPNARGIKRGLETALAGKAAGVVGSAALVKYPLLLEFARRTRHVNLLREWPGSKQRGSAFPMDHAELMAARLVSMLQRGYAWDRTDRVIQAHPTMILLAGHRVGRAFGYMQDDYFAARDPIDDVEAQVFVVPHPSGLNRYWADPRNRIRARAFLEGLVRESDAIELSL